MQVIRPKACIAGVSSVREAAIGSKHRSKYIMCYEMVGWVGIREAPNCRELWPCLCMVMEEASHTLMDLMRMVRHECF